MVSLVILDRTGLTAGCRSIPRYAIRGKQLFAIAVVLIILLSAVLLSLDTRHRRGEISYRRVIIAVAITFFDAGSLTGQTAYP